MPSVRSDSPPRRAAGVTLEADVLKAIDEALDPVVERDPTKTLSPASRP